ncbi:MAG: tRNA (adenosine(37)-N6)-threonylcarbamoyltransferase complex ATPase subunit type 1 TsaE [Polyangiales bacterium]
MSMFVFPLPTRRATIRLARALSHHIAPGDLVVLDGGLGAGKTFLVRALLRALGVPHEIAVPSPTFTLMNEYGCDLGARVPVVHVDLYRLLSAASPASPAIDLTEGSPPWVDDHELANLGLRDRRSEGWALVVEWGASAISPLGADCACIRIETHPRTAHLAGFGERGNSLVSDVASTLSLSFGRK